MSFRHLEAVEVCKKREGFAADVYYRPATFVAAVGGDRCLVQYKTPSTPLNDAGAAALDTEHVPADSIRPAPPAPAGPSRSDYTVAEKVDAFNGGAWWVGRVSRVEEEGGRNRKLYVRLDLNGDELEFPFYRIRAHLDWRAGHWVSPRPSRAPRPRSPSSSPKQEAD